MLNSNLKHHQHLLPGVKMSQLKFDNVKLTTGFRFLCHGRKCLLFAQTNIVVLVTCCRLVRLSQSIVTSTRQRRCCACCCCIYERQISSCFPETWQPKIISTSGLSGIGPNSKKLDLLWKCQVYKRYDRSRPAY